MRSRHNSNKCQVSHIRQPGITLCFFWYRGMFSSVRVILTRIPRQCLPHRRTFFASSTDHTKLLQTAEVICLPQGDGTKQYVMVARGMDEATVQKVPQLHLARIFLNPDGKTMYGAKVVNRALGKPATVCGKLLDTVLEDAGNEVQALSTLHGLSEWVLKGLQDESIEALTIMKEPEVVDAVKSIAMGNLGDGLYDDGIEGWEALAREYVSRGLGEEAALYESKGGHLIKIEHHADTTEFSDTSGGAMAVFSFS